MKRLKTSILCMIVAISLTVSVFAVKQVKTADDTFQTDSSYITAENLALNKGKKKFKKLTDGNPSTGFKSLRKSNTPIDIDLENTEQINCIVLKEDGLNIKDFTILISKDGKTYSQIYHGDKIEYHRLCTFDAVTARYIRIFVNESDNFFRLKEIEVYNQPKVNNDNFRMTGYVLNSDFQEILQNDEIKDKHSAIKELLENYHFSGLTHVNLYCGISFDENGNIFVGDPNGDIQKQSEELQYMVDCMREFGKEKYQKTPWPNSFRYYRLRFFLAFHTVYYAKMQE